MFNTSQEFSALGQAQVDKAVRLSSILLSGAERLMNLQLDIARRALSDQADTFRSLTQVREPKALAELQAGYAQPAIDRAFANARNFYDAAVATQNELTAFIEEQVADTNRQMLGMLDRVGKSAPVGSDAAVTALKTFVNSTNAALESVSRTAQKVGAELAEAGVEAATNSAKAATAAVPRSKKPIAQAVEGQG